MQGGTILCLRSKILLFCFNFRKKNKNLLVKRGFCVTVWTVVYHKYLISDLNLALTMCLKLLDTTITAHALYQMEANVKFKL